jgi:hypothetical protein
MRSERAARDAAPLVTLPVPDVIDEVVPEFFSCCIDTYCHSVDDDQTSPRQLCINCNFIAHLACCENLVLQNPVNMEFVVSVRDFTRAAKSRIRATPKSQHGTLFFCFLCMANIRAAKEKKMAKMAKKAMPRAPRKTSFIVKFPAKILAELRRLAAFHCQTFVFLECEKTNRAGMYALMEEQFYGDPEKRIKGVLDQLIDGDNAFGFLYNKHEGVNGIERTLKPICCGNSTSMNYVAGVHFNAKMIWTKSHKKLSGLSLWRAGLDVSRSIKKAMAILPKLDVKVVNLGKMIDTTQNMIDVKMRLADSIVRNGMGDELRMSVFQMMEKIEKWNEELELMIAEKRESNPILGRVLEHAARSMGLTAPRMNRTSTLATVDLGTDRVDTMTTGTPLKSDDENFVTSLLTNTR